MKNIYIIIALLAVASTAVFAQTTKQQPNRALDQNHSICVNDGGVVRCLTVHGPTAQVYAPLNDGTAAFVRDGSNLGSGYGFQGVGILGLYTNSSERITVALNGNVGIRRTNPDTLLHIRHSGTDTKDTIQIDSDDTSFGTDNPVSGVAFMVRDPSFGPADDIGGLLQMKSDSSVGDSMRMELSAGGTSHDAGVNPVQIDQFGNVESPGSIHAVGALNTVRAGGKGIFGFFSSSTTTSCDTHCATEDVNAGLTSGAGQCLAAWTGSGTTVTCGSTGSSRHCFCVAY